MRITIELAKVGFVHVRHSFFAALEWWSIGVLGLNASLHYSNLGSRVSYFPRPTVLNSGPETRDSKRETILSFRLHPTDEAVRETTFDMHMVVVSVPCEIVFLQPLR